jgi:glycosyltransferase involved in cell wall biosynthesis
MSGTPILSTNLNGFGKEYLDVMFIIKNNTPEEITKRLIEIYNLSKENLKRKAEEARSMVINHKNWKIQTQKLYEWLMDKTKE